ncbi:MAG: hypothetical protein IT513_01760 [Burkholderiales bacterium]|nr:hypothetical protein [Burkholderiales bacterium]
MAFNPTRRRVVAGMALAPIAAGAPAIVRAQSEKPLTIVLTVTPGTASDNLARMLGERLRARLNRPLVVEAKPGAGGLLAIQYLKERGGDGSFLLMTAMSSISLLPLFTSKPTFDLDKDIHPVVECASAPFALTVNASSGLKTVSDYFDSVRKDPKRGSIGVPSVTSTMALVIFRLARDLNLPLQRVGYRGGTPLLADLLGNQIPASGSVLPDYLENHRSGKLKILALLDDKRSVLAPDIPTFAEAGYPGYVATTSWGLYGVAGMPKALAAQYAAIVTEALGSAPIVEAMHKMGLVPMGGTPEQFLRKVHDDRQRWAPVIKASGISLDS